MKDFRLLTAAAVLAALTGTAFGQVAKPPMQPASAADCFRVESERFVFHSDPWINLHHFLFQWARNVPARQPGDRRRVVGVGEPEQLGRLDAEERQAWDRALDYYRERLIAGDLLFDRGLLAVRERLAGAACSAAGLGELDVELRTVLEEAMAVYRNSWWPDHHRGNVAWIREQVDALKVYEAVLSERLAEAYGGEWPAERVRVDAAAYTNWAGAYTTNHPASVAISSTDYAGLEGLEILFHEVSHASFFEQRLLGQVAAAFRKRGAKPPNRFVHTIQFITPAELLRSTLSVEELARYRSVGVRVLERGSLKEQYRIVLKHWRPFLDGQIDRGEALDRIVEELAEVGREISGS
jgi:hypothetical protein